MRIMKPCLFIRQLSLATITVIASMNPSMAQISTEATALATKVAQALAPASSLKVKAKHRIDPAIAPSKGLSEGPLQITVQRPNRCHVYQAAGDQTRELAFDGKTFVFINPVLKIHAVEPLRAATLDELGDRLDQRFGFRPPVLELLSADLPKQLFANATSASVTGREWIGWTRCERLHIEQEGLTGDLWVGTKDHLPRRLLLTFTGTAARPQWDIRVSDWELGAPVDERLFTKRPAADSQPTKLLKSR